MIKPCHQCQTQFEITQEDLVFYDKISPVFNGVKYSLPSPTLCRECRQQRRYAWRNERSLYRRKCDATGKDIISIYSPDKPFKVYETETWWGDSWDPMEYGRDFDFSRNFSDQFKELLLSVPTLSIMNLQCENSDYTNQSYQNKSCYMCFATDLSEDCYYTDYSFSCKNCVDNIGIHDCELCYECNDCTKCYNTFFSQDCSSCRDSYFCSFCRNCSNCFGCTGLRGKEYHIYNKKHSKEEYENKVKALRFTYEVIKKCKDLSVQEKLKYPHPHAVMTNCENCTGNYLGSSKNANYCFDGRDIEDAMYSTLIPKQARNFYDVDGGGMCSFLYESFSSMTDNGKFTGLCWNGISNLVYCILCMNNTKDCFGCVGLKQSQYCILNKKYTKEEYENLIPKIIKHMANTKEWGEFFQHTLSPFGYNETVANDYYPLSKDEILKRGWNYYEEPGEEKKYTGPKYDFLEDIEKVPEEITTKILACEQSQRPYKIIKQELAFYKRFGLPVPKKCHQIRYKDRLNLRNPRKLWERACDKCQSKIQTSFAPNRPEKVYCEKCYLSEVIWPQSS